MAPSPQYRRPAPDLRAKDRGGFALIVTITLLAFLVLLLVSLAVLTKVETQVAANNQKVEQARQNALMALNIAIGQLQKFAGPDQRVTGTADLGSGSGGTRLAAGSPATNTATSAGLVAVQPGTRYWTAIWGNNSSPVSIYSQAPTPYLAAWLVSGNESTVLVTDPATGSITSSNARQNATLFRPNSATGLGLTAAKKATDFLPDNANQRYVLLVGANSADSGGRTLPDNSTETALDRYIVAPLVSITVPTNLVPGLGTSTTPLTIGKYAYWIGDEGVKAKYNISDPYTARTNPANEVEARYRLLTAQRNGIEQITGFSTYAGSTVNNLSQPDLNRIKHTLQSNQIPFAQTFATPQTPKQTFHDITTHSRGVLADSQNGGLRRDLTSYLENPLPAPDPQTPYEPAVGRNIIPVNAPVSTPAQGPKWDVLRSFYQASLYTDSTKAAEIEVQAATPTQAGISPVLAQARMLFGVKVASGTFHVVGEVAVFLGNPYSTTLVSSNPIDFSVQLHPAVAIAHASAGDIGITAGTATSSSIFPATSPTYLLLGKRAGISSSNPQGLLDRIRFRIPSLSIPPGKTVCYRIPNGVVTIPATGPAFTLIPLAPGDPVGDGSAAFEVNTGYATPATMPATWDAWTTEGGTLGGTARCNISFFIKDETGRTLTSVTGTDMGGTGNKLNEVGGIRFARFFNLKIRPPLDSETLNPVIDHRTYYDYNIRAAHIIQPLTAELFGGMPTAAPYEFRYDDNASHFTADISSPAGPYGYWGRGMSDDSPTSEMQLFDMPRASRVGPAYEIPILSLGQLQHANLTADDEHINVGHQPAYAVGNSIFNPYVTRGAAFQSRLNRYAPPPTPAPSTPAPAPFNYTDHTNTNYYDISYLLNCALWDRYFFSTTPPNTASGFQLNGSMLLPNRRIEILSTAQTDLIKLRTGRGAAANLLIDGPFNINSTSVEAWKALLGSTNRLNTKSETSSTEGAVFTRSWAQPNTSLLSGSLADMETEKAYAGFRRLTAAQIDLLAEKIVNEVRKRGPFVSLAHFINRTLAADSTATNPDADNMKGALQQAIKAADVNTPTPINHIEQVKFNGGLLGVFAYADPFHGPSFDSKSTGIPGWLTQADILQALGPVLSARSDTFTIRAYGDVRNPVDPANTTPISRAWCEAVVQRMPEYVSATNPAEHPVEQTALDSVNQTFGRRFKVVSFRWLGPDDI